MIRGCNCGNKFVIDIINAIYLCPTCGGADNWTMTKANDEVRAGLENQQRGMVAAKPPIVPSRVVKFDAPVEQLKTHELCGWTQPDGWNFCAKCGVDLRPHKCMECGASDGDVHKDDCAYLARMKAQFPVQVWTYSPSAEIKVGIKEIASSLSLAAKKINESTKPVITDEQFREWNGQSQTHPLHLSDADRLHMEKQIERYMLGTDPSEDDTDDDIPVPVIVEKPKFS